MTTQTTTQSNARPETFRPMDCGDGIEIRRYGSRYGVYHRGNFLTAKSSLIGAMRAAEKMHVIRENDRRRMGN